MQIKRIVALIATVALAVMPSIAEAHASARNASHKPPRHACEHARHHQCPRARHRSAAKPAHSADSEERWSEAEADAIVREIEAEPKETTCVETESVDAEGNETIFVGEGCWTEEDG